MYKRHFRGQNKEDSTIFEHLSQRNIVADKRIVIDIGAFDGVDLSNTYFFMDNFGCHVIAVEAVPEIFEKLIKNTSEKKSRYTYVNYAITVQDIDSVEFWISPEDFVSTDDPAIYRKWRHAAKYNPQKKTIPAMSCKKFVELIDETPLIISVDTEGSSVEVANELYNLGQRPDYWIIEHDNKTIKFKEYTQIDKNAENIILAKDRI